MLLGFKLDHGLALRDRRLSIARLLALDEELVACIAVHDKIVVIELALIARCLAAGVVVPLRMALQTGARVLLREARTLVLGCLLEAIIERVIQRIELVVSCAGRRLLGALAAGVRVRGLLGVPATAVIIDRVGSLPRISLVAQARSVLVLHATITTGERILSIPMPCVRAMHG